MKGTALSATTQPKKHFRPHSLSLLLAAAAGVGMFAVSTGTASAALKNSDGSLIPVYVQSGSANLPSGTRSIDISVADGNSACTNIGTNETNTGIRASEGDQMRITAYTGPACGTSQVADVILNASYNGPSPKSGMFSKVIVSVSRQAVFACTDGGWTDGNAAACRQG